MVIPTTACPAENLTARKGLALLTSEMQPPLRGAQWLFREPQNNATVLHQDRACGAPGLAEPPRAQESSWKQTSQVQNSILMRNAQVTTREKDAWEPFLQHSSRNSCRSRWDHPPSLRWHLERLPNHGDAAPCQITHAGATAVKFGKSEVPGVLTA